MAGLQFVLACLVVTTVLAPVARRLDIPFPIILVLGGLGLAFIPGLPRVEFDPDVAFLIFVPPLLYWASLNTSVRELRRNLRAVSLLAVGLVLVTLVAVAAAAHAVVHGLPWPAAFVLGTIVAPPDAAVATSVARRLGVPRRVLSVLEGETLLNDTTAFVSYRMAVGAVVTGTFSLSEAALRFVLVGAGGVAVGLAVAWAIAHLRRLSDNASVGNAISLLTPFAAYLPAEHLGASGVLAVVTAGLALGRVAPSDLSPRTRIQTQGVWHMLDFLLGGLIFILIGLELGRVARTVLHHGDARAAWQTLAISAVVILVRIAWVFATSYVSTSVSHALDGRPPDAPAGPTPGPTAGPTAGPTPGPTPGATQRSGSWRTLTLVAWTGMRGGDSLVTALALPRVTARGVAFPGRDTILVVSFGVILVTLVVQGLTLRPLVRWLRIPADPTDERETTQALRRAAERALAKLDEICARERLPGPVTDALRAQLTGHTAQDIAELSRATNDRYRHVEREVLDARRAEVIRLRDEGAIDDQVLRALQWDLDLEALRIEGVTDDDAG